jgi:hypothetical protein
MMDEIVDVTFTLSESQAADLVNNVTRLAPDNEGLPDVVYVLQAQYNAQIPPA